jgi:hypothetical protein
MMIVHPTSLSETLDSAAETLFYQNTIFPPVRNELAAMLISRQIQSGSNSGFFLPFASESRTQSTLFTGEPLRTEFACQNIQLIEATRLLVLIGMENPETVRSVGLADRRMNTLCFNKFCAKGECKSLTIAYMRYLVAVRTNDASKSVDQFLTKLGTYRDGKGKWQGFPHYYTLLMLSESDSSIALEELEYTVPLSDGLRKQDWSDDRFSNRRQSILQKINARSEHHAYPLLLGQYG